MALTPFLSSPAVASSDSESDSEFSSSSLDDKPLPGGSKGLKVRKHQAESGEESAVSPGMWTWKWVVEM